MIGASERGANASKQFSDGERLGDVIVCAEVETVDLIRNLVLGGEHDDGHAGGLTHASTDLHTIHLGQHDIEQDEIKVFFENAFERKTTVALGDGVEALMSELELNEAGNARLIFDDQNLAFVGH